MSNTSDLSSQMRDLTRCLSTFIEEQKEFNHRMEQRLSTSPVNPSVTSNQLQQQVVTQGLLVNLNTAYREIAVLQSEINALRSENNRLASSISFDHQYRHVPQMRSNRSETHLKEEPRPRARRSRFDETNEAAAVHVGKIKLEATSSPRPKPRPTRYPYDDSNLRRQLYSFDPPQTKELGSSGFPQTTSTTIQVGEH